MMVTIETYARRWRTVVKKLVADPKVRGIAKVAGHFFAGLLVSAASLAQQCQPLAMGMLCAFTGWKAAVMAVGAACGYLLFWGTAGYQGLLWLGLALPVALILGRRQIIHESVFLMSSIAALIVSASGLFFQIFRQDTTPVGIYLLRILAGAVSARVFYLVRARRSGAKRGASRSGAIRRTIPRETAYSALVATGKVKGHGRSSSFFRYKAGQSRFLLAFFSGNRQKMTKFASTDTS
jgi:hypothetical protein